ncbi:glutamate racemase [Gardnerella pickettii]|uniref:Glutamate racemase n=1 Tax=Gardnerella pickettii TaxID=2914924 RepID=A0ABX4SGK6_9BIFI|nr:glutamate racemase [Gardnerella pickettii]EIK86023.1 glutamate racemase [Gardnerella pickettii 00703C2mash]PKZ53102.1 glutamate racemase [Gardnerella pickettii]
MTSCAPIGVFDSGLGGISVVRQLSAAMPNERIVYFGDSANAPYGIKTPQEVRDLSFKIVEHFASLNVKAVVIACNTATSAAVKDLRAHYNMPIIGMEPALKLACDLGGGKPQCVIVAATPLTLRERKFAELMNRFTQNHKIFSKPCPDLVEIVENGDLGNKNIVMSALHKYFDSYDLTNIDSVVLGCTHFVFYKSYFREFLPDCVNIVDGNDGTIHHLKSVLESKDLLAPSENSGSVVLTNSDSSNRIAKLAQSLLNGDF